MRGYNMQENYDFTQGTRGPVVKTNKERVTIRLDADTLDWFRQQCTNGGSYQAMINDALRQHINQQGEPLESLLRRVIKEEMAWDKWGPAGSQTPAVLNNRLLGNDDAVTVSVKVLARNKVHTTKAHCYVNFTS